MVVWFYLQGTPLPSSHRFYRADIIFSTSAHFVSQTVRLYDAKENNPLAKFDNKGPSLDCCFTQNDGSILTGGLDRTLRCFDVASGDTSHPTVLGHHEKPIRCVDSSPSMVCVCSFAIVDYISRVIFIYTFSYLSI